MSRCEWPRLSAAPRTFATRSSANWLGPKGDRFLESDLDPALVLHRPDAASQVVDHGVQRRPLRVAQIHAHAHLAGNDIARVGLDDEEADGPTGVVGISGADAMHLADQPTRREQRIAAGLHRGRAGVRVLAGTTTSNHRWPSAPRTTPIVRRSSSSTGPCSMSASKYAASRCGEAAPEVHEVVPQPL
jgi:hypothetical protein